VFKRTVGGVVLVFAGVLGGMLGYHAWDSRASEQEAQTYVDWVKQQKLTPVKFVVKVPEGTPPDQPVYLSGSMSQFPWDAAGTPLTKQTDGTYSTTIDVMTGLSHEFKVTRGTWGTVECKADDTDRDNRPFIAKGGDTIEAVVEAWRDKGAATPGKVTYTGDIREHKKLTDGVLVERNITVYLPPGYNDEASKDLHYPVLYLNDGQNLFDESASYNGVEWKVDETAQRLITEGKIEPVIIVGIWNTPNRDVEYTPQALTPGDAKSQNAAFANVVVSTVKAFVDARYRTKPEPDSTGIGGAGLGALAAVGVVQEKPEAFGKLVLLSPQLHVGEKAGQSAVAALVGDGAAFKDKKVWLDASPDAANNTPVTEATALADLLKKSAGESNVKFVPLTEPSNNEPAWQQRFDQVLIYLFGK
jgi:predicted alpha/beta superfamily hydrolase